MLYGLLHCIFLLSNVMVYMWQSHLEDQHDNETSFNIGTQDGGPLGNR
jgi:hypothetical protein